MPQAQSNIDQIFAHATANLGGDQDAAKALIAAPMHAYLGKGQTLADANIETATALIDSITALDY